MIQCMCALLVPAMVCSAIIASLIITAAACVQDREVMWYELALCSKKVPQEVH